MTDSEQGEQSPVPEESINAAEESNDAQASTSPGPRSEVSLPSRRKFLQASGLAIGMSAVRKAKAQDQQSTEIRHSQDPTMTDSNRQESPLRTTTQIPLSTGKQILDAMEEKAEEIGVPSVLTVTDAEGNLVAQRRMDDAWLPSVNISRNKAYTAAGFEMPTHELADVTVPGESLWGLHVTDENRIVVFGGGFPLEAEDTVVGAVGASGGQVDQDRQVASAGVQKFQDLLR